MENEELTVDENLKAAFNNGYLIGKYKGDIGQILQENLSKAADNTEILKAFQAGIEQGQKDIALEKQEIELRDIRRIREKKEQEKELGRDLD